MDFVKSFYALNIRKYRFLLFHDKRLKPNKFYDAMNTLDHRRRAYVLYSGKIKPCA